MCCHASPIAWCFRDASVSMKLLNPYLVDAPCVIGALGRPREREEDGRRGQVAQPARLLEEDLPTCMQVT